MLIRKIILVFLVLALCSTQRMTFEEFKIKFNKLYARIQLEIQAEYNFNRNQDQIERSNAQNSQYQRAVNQFSDMTQSQAQIAAGLRRITPPQNISRQHPQTRLGQTGTLPIQVDWRAEGKVSAVKNQGTCGCCWSFTTVGMYESFLMIGGMSEPDLSEQFVLECTSAASPVAYPSSCGGGYLDFSIPFVVSSGIPLESQFPYLAINYPINTAGYPTTPGICSTTNKIIDTAFNGVYQGDYLDVTADTIKQLVSYAPIAVAIYANADFMTYRSGIFTGCPSYATSKANVNHAVVLVGYDANGNYIIKNSWGTSWGDNGFGIISKDFDCGISYLPRQIRGSNPQLQSAFNLFVGVALMLVFLFI